MGMSTHVIGVCGVDDQYIRMKAVYDACEDAGVGLPSAVADYFRESAPDQSGRLVEIPSRRWEDESREGFEVDLATLPDEVKTIRFYNSW
jgi:hypothetical protein